MKMPVIRGEGPFALILLPSVNYYYNLYIIKKSYQHELAIQTYELAKEYSRLLQKEGFPCIHSLIGIGGMDMSS